MTAESGQSLQGGLAGALLPMHRIDKSRFADLA